MNRYVSVVSTCLANDEKNLSFRSRLIKVSCFFMKYRVYAPCCQNVSKTKKLFYIFDEKESNVKVIIRAKIKTSIFE